MARRFTEDEVENRREDRIIETTRKQTGRHHSDELDRDAE